VRACLAICPRKTSGNQKVFQSSTTAETPTYDARQNFYDGRYFFGVYFVADLHPNLQSKGAPLVALFRFLRLA
jgi:hypothetical protein